MEVTHEQIAKYFNPKGDMILIEFTDEVKTSGGVLLEKPERSLAHPVIAVGEGVSRCAVGDWVMIDVPEVGTLKVLGKRIALVRDYQISMVVDMSYILIEKQIREAKRLAAELLNKNEGDNLKIV